MSDYFGLESGRKVNKVERVDATYQKSKKVNAPVFDMYPLTLECVLDHVNEEEGFYFGRVVGMVVDEEVLDASGVVDFDECRFLALDYAKKAYRVVGEIAGMAFHDGLRFM